MNASHQNRRGHNVAQSLATLEGAFRAVLRNQHNAYSYEDLYSIAYHLVLDRQIVHIEELIQRTCSEYVRSTINPIVMDALDDNLLDTLLDQYGASCAALQLIASICLYFDHSRRREPEHSGNSDVFTLGIIQFRDYCLLGNDYAVVSKLSEAMLGVVERQRTGQFLPPTAAQKVKSASDMLITLSDRGKKFRVPLLSTRSLYIQLFEEPFLVQSMEFFELEARCALETKSLSVFASRVLERIAKETELAETFLHASSMAALLDAVKSTMVIRNVDGILALLNDNDGGLLDLISDRNVVMLLQIHKILRMAAGEMDNQCCLRFYQAFIDLSDKRLPNGSADFSESQQKSQLALLQAEFSVLSDAGLDEQNKGFAEMLNKLSIQDLSSSNLSMQGEDLLDATCSDAVTAEDKENCMPLQTTQ